MKKLNDSEKDVLELLNSYLLEATKVDFISKIEKCAACDTCTEVEVKEFLRNNYPGASEPKNLTKADKQLLSILLRYYVQKDKENSKIKKASDAVKFAYPKAKPSLEFYDSSNIRSFKTLYELSY